MTCTLCGMGVGPCLRCGRVVTFAGGDIAPPRAATLSIVGTLVAIAILLAFAAWLVWPAINAVAEAASTRPNACATLTPDECTAVMEAR